MTTTYPAQIQEADIQAIVRALPIRASFLDDALQEARLKLWMDGVEHPGKSRTWYVRRAENAAKNAAQAFFHERAPVTVETFTDAGLDPNGEPVGAEDT